MELLKDYISQYKIVVDSETFDRFELYCNMLIEWNKKINLTAIIDPIQIQIKHFLDSLLVMKCIAITHKMKMLDVGTGAGFPGVPIKIANPNIDLILLDSLNKRLKFLDKLLKQLNLSASLLHLRAEEGSKDKKLREDFDLVTARAVASLNVLCEYCLPYVKVGGVFVAMKGPTAIDEVKKAQNAIKLLGGEVEKISEFKLPDNSQRLICVIKKNRKTHDIYPRHGSKISKNPL